MNGASYTAAMCHHDDLPPQFYGLCQTTNTLNHLWLLSNL